jgi:hypothetical protein
LPDGRAIAELGAGKGIIMTDEVHGVPAQDPGMESGRDTETVAGSDTDPIEKDTGDAQPMTS